MLEETERRLVKEVYTSFGMSVHSSGSFAREKTREGTEQDRIEERREERREEREERRREGGKNLSVCRFKTLPCVRSGRLRVYPENARMFETP